MKILRATFLAAACGLVFSLSFAVPATAEPTTYETQAVTDEATGAFFHIMDMWREEAYFELYDEGWYDSAARLTREEFAQRMVEIPWVPAEKVDPKFTKASFRYRSMVYVNAKLVLKHKFNPDRKITRDVQFLLLKENGKWKIDAVQLIRSPY